VVLYHPVEPTTLCPYPRLENFSFLKVGYNLELIKRISGLAISAKEKQTEKALVCQGFAE
jgi:hypothetical protein